MPGPIPKRADARRRRNSKNADITKVEAAGVVKAPPLPKETSELARQWYNSLKRSAQSRYYEPSDWAAALLVCHQLTMALAESALAIKKQDYTHMALSSRQFSTIWGAMGELLTTEGARRRVRLEIERASAVEEPEPEGVTAISDYRKRMQAQQAAAAAVAGE